MREKGSIDSGTQSQGTFLFSKEESAGDREPSGHPGISAHQNERVPKGEPPSRIFSVGWAVSDNSISENDHRYVCAVVAYDQVIQGSGDVAPARKILEKQFVIEMRPKATPPATDDVSGLLGLLSPWGSTDDKDSHAQFERALSEIQMWALYACLEKAKTAEGRSVVLIQGPLLPKLRGRIFYRMLDVERCTLYVVSSESRWVRRLVGEGNGDYRNRAGGADEAPVLGRSGVYEWTGPIPELALDSSSRDFIGRHLGTEEIHVAVPANVLPARNATDFWQQCKRDLEKLFESAEELPMHAGAKLPSVLRIAIQEAENAKEAILPRLRDRTRIAAAAQEDAETHGGSSTETTIPAVVSQFVSRQPIRQELLSFSPALHQERVRKEWDTNIDPLVEHVLSLPETAREAELAAIRKICQQQSGAIAAQFKMAQFVGFLKNRSAEA